MKIVIIVLMPINVSYIYMYIYLNVHTCYFSICIMSVTHYF